MSLRVSLLCIGDEAHCLDVALDSLYEVAVALSNLETAEKIKGRGLKFVGKIANAPRFFSDIRLLSAVMRNNASDFRLF